MRLSALVRTGAGRTSHQGVVVHALELHKMPCLEGIDLKTCIVNSPSSEGHYH